MDIRLALLAEAFAGTALPADVAAALAASPLAKAIHSKVGQQWLAGTVSWGDLLRAIDLIVAALTIYQGR